MYKDSVELSESGTKVSTISILLELLTYIIFQLLPLVLATYKINLLLISMRLRGSLQNLDQNPGGGVTQL